MRFDFFKSQIDRLRTEWKSAYGKERETVMFAALKDVNENTLRDAVTELLLNHKGGAPTGDEIKSAIYVCDQAQRQEDGFKAQQAEPKDPRDPYDCEPCGDSGYQLIEDEKGYRRVYMCDCKHAKARPNKLFWKSGFTHEIPGHLEAKKP